MRTRFAIISVWKPLAKRVMRDPLCVCDIRTVDAGRDVAKLVAKSQWGDFSNSGVRYHFEYL